MVRSDNLFKVVKIFLGFGLSSNADCVVDLEGTISLS